jgi:type II secretory pathway pseudopilin PulG
MITISDADLMAYADGVLPRQARPLVRQALGQDPALLEKLESFILTNRGLARPFDRLPPIPDRLRQVLARSEPEPDAGGETRWFAPRQRRPTAAASARLRIPAWSLAAMLALLCAAALPWYLRAPDRALAQPQAGQRLLAAQLQRTLETAESNVAAALVTLKPTGTFLSTTKQWCRQYDLLSAEGGGLKSIACRDEAGAWRLKTATPTAGTPEANGYVPAGKLADQSNEAAGIERTLGTLMRDVVLLPAEERKLIADGWQVPR